MLEKSFEIHLEVYDVKEHCKEILSLQLYFRIHSGWDGGSLESKINLWDLGIENLSDGFRTLLKDLKKLLKLEKRWDSKFNLRNVIFFSVTSLRNDD